jgi:hypothetical protein
MKKLSILIFTILTFLSPVYFCCATEALLNSITFTPSSAKVGELVTINSESIIGGGAKVYFNGVKAPATVTEAMYEITVKVPTGATTGKIAVKTEKFGTFTSDKDFIVGSNVVTGDSPSAQNPPSSDSSQTYSKPGIKFNGLVPVCNTGAINTDINSSNYGNYINDCDFDMIMVLVNKIINFALITLATPLFALIIMYVGFLYLTAGGSPKNIDKSKVILKNAVVGYIIALVAWLVVKSILLSLGFTDISKYLS